MNGSVLLRGIKHEFTFEKYEQGNIPAMPGVICLAVFYKDQWRPLQFEQYFDLSKVDMSTLIQNCSKDISDLDASDVTILLDIHEVDDSDMRQFEVINLSRANRMDPFNKSPIPLLESGNLESENIIDVPVIFRGIDHEFIFMKFEQGDIPAMPGVICLAVFYKDQWRPLQFEQYFDLSKVDMNTLKQNCSKEISDLDASDVTILLDIHEVDDSNMRQSEVINLSRANRMDPFNKSPIPLLESV